MEEGIYELSKQNDIELLKKFRDLAPKAKLAVFIYMVTALEDENHLILEEINELMEDDRLKVIR